MPVFARRRLQAMLDDLAPQLSSSKAKDLLRRLEDKKRVEQVLPAEMELGLLWALSKFGPLEIEPNGGKGADCFTAHFLPLLAAIEITAVSDNSLSGEEVMDRIALQICSIANRVKKRSGQFLYFSFREEHGYENGRYFRRRLAPANYQLPASTVEQVSTWVAHERRPGDQLPLHGVGLSMVVEWKAYRQIRYHNCHCSMPPEAYDLVDNPLYEALERKLGQLKGAPSESYRLIFLADVGSTLLNRLGTLGEIDFTRRRYSGREIILKFVSEHSDRLDGVVVFSPKREEDILRREVHWRASMFPRSGFDVLPDPVKQLLTYLPRPRYEGYQARSLFRQGVFDPKGRGEYLGTHIRWNKETGVKVSMPARALLDLLAGRISPEQFRYFIGDDKNKVPLFQHYLDTGHTLSKVEIESGGFDHDDDHLVFEFTDDPAARPLKTTPNE